MGEKTNSYKVLVRNPEGEMPLGKPRRRWEVKVKVKLSLSRPWRSLGMREVVAPTFSDIRNTDDGKVVSPMRRPLFTPRKIPGAHFS
jgi:hypothetical protein